LEFKVKLENRIYRKIKSQPVGFGFPVALPILGRNVLVLGDKKDNEVKRFYLQQAEWRCDLKKVARPFKAAFSASNWVIGWVHSMYFIKIAFDKKIIRDEDISM